MDPAQFESLVGRLVNDPHDANALAEAHHAGQHDPSSYAALLEQVAVRTTDAAFSAHWFNEAAMVWQSLGDGGQFLRLIAAVADRDPTNVAAAQQVAQAYRDAGDQASLIGVLERMTRALRPLLTEQPEFAGALKSAHEELAGAYSSGPFADADAALQHWAALVEVDPTHAYAIYQAREQFKARGEWTKALPLFAAERALGGDPERSLALGRDELEVCRAAGDLAAVSRVLRDLVALQPDDGMVAYELACSVVARVDANHVVDDAERADAARVMTKFAESYDGEHGMSYAVSALKAQPSDDRALQLADYYAESLGWQSQLVDTYRAYLAANPAGYMAAKARDVLTSLGVPAMVLPEPLASAPGQQAAPLELLVPAAPRVAEPVAVPEQAPVAAPAPAVAAAALAPAVTPSAQAPAAPLDGVAALLEQAKRAADTKQTLRALDLYRRVLAETPAHPEALGYVEETLRQQRKFEELSDVLLAAARHGSQSTETRKAQLNDVAGICESKLKNYDKAIDAWKLIVQLDRGDRQARERLATLLEKQKRFDDLAPMLEQQAMNADDGEEKVALERRLAQMHERDRNDLPAAAETWLRIAALTPDDHDALGTAADLFERAGLFEQAMHAVETALAQSMSDGDRGRWVVRSAELTLKLGDAGRAGEKYLQAGDLLADDALRTKAVEAFRQANRWADVARVLEDLASRLESKAKSELLVEVSVAYDHAGDRATGGARFEEAALLDSANETLAATLVERYEADGDVQRAVAFFLARAGKLDDKARRTELRHRAAAVQRNAGDEAGARATLESVLADGEDLPALQILFQSAEQAQDFAAAASYGERIVALTTGEDRLAYAVRVAQLHADTLGDLATAAAKYRRILEQFDPTNAYSLHALADLETRLGNHGAAATALEQLAGLLDGMPGMGDRRVEILRRLMALYDGPLADEQAAVRVLEALHAVDSEDFDAVTRLARLHEKLENWGRAAELLGRLIEVEGEEAECSRLTRKLAALLVDHLDRTADALGTLEKLADQGDEPCRDAFCELGVRIGAKARVASKLRGWHESKASPQRGARLRQAFELFLDDDQKVEARALALELFRSKEVDATLGAKLEELAIALKDLEALAVAHEVSAKSLTGIARAEELVRQAEQLLQTGSDVLEAISHGEMALNSVEPSEAAPLLARLAAIATAPGHVIDLFERQVLRCKKPDDRIDALARAAMVAAGRGAADRAREFFGTALSGGVQESNIAVLERAAREADASSGAGQPLVLRTLVESLAAGGQNSRDGGRTRAALLRRAAQLAHLELGDTEAAFAWLSEAVIASADDATMDALEKLAAEVGEPRRLDAALGRALEEVFDGPVVRKLLRKRADQRLGVLADKAGAAEDLKRLHDLAPADQDLTKELAQILTELGNHRGMIELYEDQILRGRQPHVRAELARKVALLWEESLGDAREAADAWRRVLRMKAGDKEALAGVERCKSGRVLKPSPGASSSFSDGSGTPRSRSVAPPAALVASSARARSMAPPPPPASAAPAPEVQVSAPTYGVPVAPGNWGNPGTVDVSDLEFETGPIEPGHEASSLGAIAPLPEHGVAPVALPPPLPPPPPPPPPPMDYGASVAAPPPFEAPSAALESNHALPHEVASRVSAADDGHGAAHPEPAPLPATQNDDAAAYARYQQQLQAYQLQQQGYDPNAYAQQGYDPNAYAPQGYDPNAYAPQGYDPNAYAQQSHDPNAYGS
jgi:hypothetical protein